VYLLLVNCKFDLIAANCVICEPAYLLGMSFCGKKWTVYVCLYVCVYVCMCIYIYMCVCVCVCVCMLPIPPVVEGGRKKIVNLLGVHLPKLLSYLGTHTVSASNFIWP